ncbi:MAG: hypothetical protein QOI47_2273 [Actinomycetota bacterium]|nr:hypothetical protein [Actinomycetota bacterium]
MLLKVAGEDADPPRMTDVSRLLDDLYAEEAPTRAPSWSSEEALDDAFAAWVPGPDDHASSAERAVVAGAQDLVTFAPESSADAWLADTAPEPPVELDHSAPTARPRWSPSDDDILPAAKRRRR